MSGEKLAHEELRKEVGYNMQINISPQPLMALIAGILIFFFPKLLNYIVAVFLILFGILGLIQ
jgi:hypothetical protein